MSDIGSAQCGDVYVDESDALYRVISTENSTVSVTVQRIEGEETERFRQMIRGSVGAGAWAGFRRVHRPIGKPVAKAPSYRVVDSYMGCPVYVESSWGDHTTAIHGIKKKLAGIA
jgi:hypothetical protein